jgi:POT family proton-dependent oligopeptide transporter
LADRYTNRSVSGTTEKMFNAVQLTQNLVYKKDSVALYDELFRLQKKDGKVIKEYNYPVYFRNNQQNNTLSEGNSISVWSTNLSQSINPLGNIVNPIDCCIFYFFKRKRQRAKYSN